MELTQALGRVLEALSPALAAELDRIVNETRQTLENEFQKRLQAAVRDAELAVQTRAALELKRAVEETRESVWRQVTEQLQAQFARILEEKANQLRQLQSEWASERAGLQEQLDQWRIFAETQRQLAEASSQPEILKRFLILAESFAPALAIYVTKANGFTLWKSWARESGAAGAPSWAGSDVSVGAGPVFPEIISEETRDPDSYFRPIVVRGKTVAAVCAALPYKREALDFLAASMERVIEMFGMRLRAPVPAPVPSKATAAVAVPSPADESS